LPTPRETILAALYTRLSALPATALRGEVLPEHVPAEGLLILRDGEPGEPEVTLSPLAYRRDPLAPIKDAVTADGDVVVPLDAEAFGFWLKAAFGAPTTTGTGP